MFKLTVKYLISALLICQALPGLALIEQEDLLLGSICRTWHDFQTDKRDLVWPGFRLDAFPTVIHFKEGSLYGFGVNQSDKWEMIEKGNVAFLKAQEDHWGIRQNMMNPSFPVDQQKAFIFCIDPSHADSQTPILTLIHERFHVHQFGHFIREKTPMTYLDSENEENLLLAKVEDMALRYFLSEPNPEAQKEHLKNFLAINAFRQGLIHPYSKTWEDHQQRMEGLADYVSFKTAEVFGLFDPFKMEDQLLNGLDRRESGGVPVSKEIVKGRHYVIGAILAHALDFCQVDWKKQVEEGTSLVDLLNQTLPMPQQEKEERFAKAFNLYHVSRIEQKLKTALKNEKEEIERVQTAYKGLKGTEVFLSKPFKGIAGGGKNFKNLFLGQGRTVAIYDTSVAKSTDQKWELAFNEMPFIFENPGGIRQFKIDDEATLTLDGQSYKVKDLIQSSNRQFFSSLAWQGRNTEFKTSLPGHLYVRQGAIYIEFKRGA